jgi:hypothetical protein
MDGGRYYPAVTLPRVTAGFLIVAITLRVMSASAGEFERSALITRSVIATFRDRYFLGSAIL